MTALIAVVISGFDTNDTSMNVPDPPFQRQSDSPGGRSVPFDSGGLSLSVSRRRRWFRFVALAGGLFAGLLLGELVLRVLNIEPQRFITKRQLIDRSADPPVYYHCYPGNPFQELEPLPDVSRGRWLLQEFTFEGDELPLDRLVETPWCVEYRHSSKGLRDREYPPRGPDDPERIAVIGDSFVFGEGVPERLTLPRQLEGLLSGRVQCVNGGQVGSNAEQQQPILDALIREAGCRRVLWVLIPNDIPLTPALAQRQTYINDFVLLRDRYLNDERVRGWGGMRPRLLDVVLTPFELSRIRQETLEWYLACASPKENADNLSLLQSLMTAAAKRRDAEVVLVLYPLLEGLEQNYQLQPVHDTFRRLAREAQLPVLDLAPVFAGQNSSDLQVDAADHHPNGTAHGIAARAIIDWLRRERPAFLPEAAP